MATDEHSFDAFVDEEQLQNVTLNLAPMCFHVLLHIELIAEATD